MGNGTEEIFLEEGLPAGPSFPAFWDLSPPLAWRKNNLQKIFKKGVRLRTQNRGFSPYMEGTFFLLNFLREVSYDTR